MTKRRIALRENPRLVARGQAEEPVWVGFRRDCFDWVVPEGLEARTGPAVRVSEEGIRLNRAAAELLCGGPVPKRVWLAVGRAHRALALSLAEEGRGYPARADRGGLRVHSAPLARTLAGEGWRPGRAYRLRFDPESGLLVAVS
jgi:hypothetical protein